MSMNDSELETGNQSGLVSYNITLEDLNNAVAKTYYGAVLFFGVLIPPGVIGNLHVLHIYIRKKPENNTRVYVCFLAMIDLLACSVTFPYNIVNCLLPYMFYSNFACKFFTFLNGFVVIAAALSLLVIALERYRKICTPFKTQVTIKNAKVSCLLVILVSSIISSPILYLYGSTRIPTIHAAFYGNECFIRVELRDTYFPMIYNGVIMTTTSCLSTAMIVLYTLIGINLWRQKAKMKQNKTAGYGNGSTFGCSVSKDKQTAFLSCDTNNTVISDDRTLECSAAEKTSSIKDIVTQMKLHDIHGTDIMDITISTNVRTEVDKDSVMAAAVPGNITPNPQDPVDQNIKRPEIIIDHKEPTTLGNFKPKSAEQHTPYGNAKPGVQKDADNKKDVCRMANLMKKMANKDKADQTRRATYMFFLITLFYLFGYIPYPILRLYQNFNMDWYRSLDLTSLIAFHTALCGLFFNNVVNSLIYTLCDRHYRQEMKAFYVKLFCRIQEINTK